MMGEPVEQGAAPAGDNSGTRLKAQVLTGALKRANNELARHVQDERRNRHVGFMREALARKRAQVRHHPGAGRTADEGMQSLPSDARTVDVGPSEVGRVSQFATGAQATRDSR